MIFALWKSNWISKQNPGNEKMQEIGLAVSEGATAFIKREYKVLTIFVLVVAALLYWVNLGNETRNAPTLCAKYKGKIIPLNTAHDGRPILMKEENSIE